MTGQDLKECIAEVKYSAIPEKSKKMIMNVLYEKQMEIEGGNSDADSNNDGWIPCGERLPEPGTYILLSYENFPVMPQIGRYEADENGGAFYPDDDAKSCTSYGLFVNAWQPLPSPYHGGDTE